MKTQAVYYPLYYPIRIKRAESGVADGDRTRDHRNHNPNNYPLSIGAKPLFRVIRLLKQSITYTLDITRRSTI